MKLSTLDHSQAALLAGLGVAVAVMGLSLTLTQGVPAAAPVAIVIMLGMLGAAVLALRFARAREGGGGDVRLSILDYGVAGLLGAVGLAVAAVGLTLTLTRDAPVAGPAGVVGMFGLFAVAAFGLRSAARGETGATEQAALGVANRNVGLAVLLVANGLLLLGAGWLLKQFMDPPGAGLIGIVMLVVNLWAAVTVLRRGR